MKTKDFIKMLQEEDPSGEGYIRVQGGAVVWVEAKEGYWDGSYQYYDPQTRKLHTTTEGYKVDVMTIDENDIVWDEEGNMEKIRERLVPNFESYSDPTQRKEKYDNYWMKIEDEAIEAKKGHEEIMKWCLDGVLEKYKEGWVCRISKDAENPYKMKEYKERGYTVSKFQFQWKKGLFKKNSVTLGEMEVFRDNESIFNKVIKGNYIYYELK